MPVTKFTADIQEFYPDAVPSPLSRSPRPVPERPENLGKAFRLVQWISSHGDDVPGGPYPDVPCFEFYEAEYEYVEGGDAETGPISYLHLGDWKMVGQGFGHYDDIMDVIKE